VTPDGRRTSIRIAVMSYASMHIGNIYISEPGEEIFMSDHFRVRLHPELTYERIEDGAVECIPEQLRRQMTPEAARRHAADY
jgi:hypothetical protein